jgi:hypothetical protein
MKGQQKSMNPSYNKTTMRGGGQIKAPEDAPITLKEQ